MVGTTRGKTAMALSRIERILILAKTYPSPSAQHVETSCVAGLTEHGCMRRLYPVPFRLIKESQKFKKWQWVKLRVEKATRITARKATRSMSTTSSAANRSTPDATGRRDGCGWKKYQR